MTFLAYEKISKKCQIHELNLWLSDGSVRKVKCTGDKIYAYVCHYERTHQLFKNLNQFYVFTFSLI